MHCPGHRCITGYANDVWQSMQKVYSLTSQLGMLLQGYGYPPEEVISLGAFPVLEELHLMDMLEGDAGPGGHTRSRFHLPHSLANLQVRPLGQEQLDEEALLRTGVLSLLRICCPTACSVLEGKSMTLLPLLIHRGWPSQRFQDLSCHHLR